MQPDLAVEERAVLRDHDSATVHTQRRAVGAKHAVEQQCVTAGAHQHPVCGAVLEYTPLVGDLERSSRRPA